MDSLPDFLRNHVLEEVFITRDMIKTVTGNLILIILPPSPLLSPSTLHITPTLRLPYLYPSTPPSPSPNTPLLSCSPSHHQPSPSPSLSSPQASSLISRSPSHHWPSPPAVTLWHLSGGGPDTGQGHRQQDSKNVQSADWDFCIAYLRIICINGFIIFPAFYKKKCLQSDRSV